MGAADEQICVSDTVKREIERRRCEGESDIECARQALTWSEVYAVDERTAVTAAKIADEIGPKGPYLAGRDGMIAAVGREHDAPVVSADSDPTHEETRAVIDIEEHLPGR